MAKEMYTNNTMIELGGSSEASISISSHLSGEVYGNSLLRYTGDPDTIDVAISIDSRMLEF